MTLAPDAGSVGVLNFEGTAVLLVRVDGGVPGLGGSAQRSTRVVPPGARRVISRQSGGGETVVKLWSETAVSYELEV